LDGGEAARGEEAVDERPEVGIGDGVGCAQGDGALEGLRIVVDRQAEALGGEVDEACELNLAGE
jgi:hypothetical protein